MPRFNFEEKMIKFFNTGDVLLFQGVTLLDQL